MQFFIWLSFPLLTATLLNNAVLGGLRLFLRAVALFAVGVAAGGAVKGWQVSRNGPALIEVISMAVLLGYTLMVAFLDYDQNMRLVTSAREIEERSRIFQALVEISTSADLASEVDDFINEALERVHRHYPRNGLGLVVRQANRNTAFRFASFVGIDQHQQEQLFQVLADTPAPKDDFHNRIELSEGTFHFLFMRGQIRGHEGLIVVRAEHIRRLLYESMGLFLELLAATIENKLMAMELKNAAERDSLTGVFNRDYRDTELAHAIRNRRQHPSMESSVVLLDVIGLKAINDTRGHLAGDAYIQGTAEALG
jgi:predicted signal transduction protein with EAL and GGDEF domain